MERFMKARRVMAALALATVVIRSEDWPRVEKVSKLGLAPPEPPKPKPPQRGRARARKSRSGPR